MAKTKRVLVLGLGVSGQSAARFLLRRGCRVVGMDRNHDLPTQNEAVGRLCQEGMVFIGEQGLPEVDQVVVSPGIPQTHPCYRQAIERGIELIGEVELACREINRPCLAITGTNGKTTVTLLTEHVLNHVGIRAKALGNVGTSLTEGVDDAAKDKTEVFVIELSSFQLETLRCRFVDAGAILNITPDHLDRYASMEEYAAAKARLGDCIKQGGKLFVEDTCYEKFRIHFEGMSPSTYGYSSSCYLRTDSYHIYSQSTDRIPLPNIYQGRKSHDLENVLASYALCCEVGVTPQAFFDALSSFKKPAHRIEFVRMLDGVRYIDDSKGTNIDAVVRAVDSVEGRVILIAGGVDKGFPYVSWIDSFGGKVKNICAIGQSKEKIKGDLEAYIPVDLFASLHDAVKHAAEIAKSGDTVLLSPGCSSYDMFKDYAHRGNEFKRIVNAL